MTFQFFLGGFSFEESRKITNFEKIKKYANNIS